MCIRDRVGSATEMVSMDAPQLTGMGMSNSAGVEVMILFVRGCGLSHFSAWARLGGSGTEKTIWASDTSIGCRFSSACQSSRHAAVTTGLGTGSLSASISFDVGKIVGVNLTNLKEAEPTSILIFGSSTGGQGLSSSARVHYTGCDETRWISITTMRLSLIHI